MRMLPLAALNIGVTITPKDNTPSAYGPIDHALCGVPLSRKAGKCHKPQMAPRMRLAHSGANRRCNSGSAKPRQPNSSPTGPIKSVVASAGSKVYKGENGKGSSIVPFMAAPRYFTAGMPPDQSDCRDPGGVDGQDENRIRATHRTEDGLKLVGEHQQQRRHAPTEPEGNSEEREQRPRRHPVRLPPGVVRLGNRVAAQVGGHVVPPRLSLSNRGYGRPVPLVPPWGDPCRLPRKCRIRSIRALH